MRRLAAISLLLVLLALSSSATSIACATSCAQMAPPAAAAPSGMMHMHRHHGMLAPATQGFAARHCAGRAPRLLAQRIVVPSPVNGAMPLRSVTPANAAGGAAAITRASFTASPPGPPVSPTQLRI